MAVTTSLSEGLRGLGDWGSASNGAILKSSQRMSAAWSAVTALPHRLCMVVHGQPMSPATGSMAWLTKAVRPLLHNLIAGCVPGWRSIKVHCWCTCACWMQHLQCCSAAYAAVFAETAVVTASFASCRKNQPHMHAHSSLHACMQVRGRYHVVYILLRNSCFPHELHPMNACSAQHTVA